MPAATAHMHLQQRLARSYMQQQHAITYAAIAHTRGGLPLTRSQLTAHTGTTCQKSLREYPIFDEYDVPQSMSKRCPYSMKMMIECSITSDVHATAPILSLSLRHTTKTCPTSCTTSQANLTLRSPLHAIVTNENWHPPEKQLNLSVNDFSWTESLHLKTIDFATYNDFHCDETGVR